MSLDVRDITLRIKEKAVELGFSAVGVTTSAAVPEGARLRDWLARGGHAGMAWMNNPEIREDPTAILPGARSMVVVGLDCRPPALTMPTASEARPKANDCLGAQAPLARLAPASEARRTPTLSASLAAGFGRIAAFARRRDYHKTIGDGLMALLEHARGLVPCRGAVAVDSRPLLERAFAVRAGLGWAGESGCVVSEKFGPWLLLGELILDVDLEYDAPVAGRCPGCGRCAKACPTGAIKEPGFVDANRCVAYLTIEHKGPIPRDLRASIGDRLFGCDACQECCVPAGSALAIGERSSPKASAGLGAEGAAGPAGPGAGGFGAVLPAGYPASRLLTMSSGEFTAEFAGTPVVRTGRVRMARNAAVVLGNSPGNSGTTALADALGDTEPIVRSHAAWALGRHGEARLLEARLGKEAEPEVREEIAAAVASLASGACGTRASAGERRAKLANGEKRA